MKGLFVKDLCYFKELVKTLVIFFLIAVMLLLFQDFKYDNLMFVFSYMIICGTMTSVNLIAYDQDQNGMAFLFTFPANRKDYVHEKYVFSAFVICVMVVLMGLLSFVAITVQHVAIEWSALGISAGVAIGIAFLMLSFLIPLKIKFEEKGNLIMIVTVFAVFAIIYFASKGIKLSSINANAISQFFEQHFTQIMVGVVAVLAIIVTCSIKISEKIISNKEY